MVQSDGRLADKFFNHFDKSGVFISSGLFGRGKKRALVSFRFLNVDVLECWSFYSTEEPLRNLLSAVIVSLRLCKLAVLMLI